MKKVQHNLKIAKNVAKRVEDLKQQVKSDQSQLQSVNNIENLDKNLPFKKEEDKTTTVEKHIPSIQDSSSESRHSSSISGNFVGTKSQNMSVKKQKKAHTKKYQENVQKAKSQIKEAEDGMKKMDNEVKEFHNHMAISMAKLMKTFTEGFTALDKAK